MIFKKKLTVVGNYNQYKEKDSMNSVQVVSNFLSCVGNPALCYSAQYNASVPYMIHVRYSTVQKNKMLAQITRYNRELNVVITDESPAQPRYNPEV